MRRSSWAMHWSNNSETDRSCIDFQERLSASALVEATRPFGALTRNHGARFTALHTSRKESDLRTRSAGSARGPQEMRGGYRFILVKYVSDMICCMATPIEVRGARLASCLLLNIIKARDVVSFTAVH
jgi:hypothetical protein